MNLKRARLINMLFRETRDGEFHLVVHANTIRDTISGLKYSGNNPEYLEELRTAIGEIERVSQLPNSKQIEHFEPDRIPADIENAQEVTLYGCNRRACLEWVSESAMEAGAYVAMSVKGTI